MNQDKTTNSLLDVREIVRDYMLPRRHLFTSPERFRALDGVSLTVNPGESFGIVGESGCGKSTLARTVMALESPQSGEVRFQGQILHSLKAEDLRRVRSGFQMIFQDPYGSLDPRQTVGQIVSEPLSLLGEINLKKRQELVAEALANVYLSIADANKFPHEFSGGQRQRIAIARALITRPALIVADEPVSALDVSVQAQVLNLMMDLRDQYGLAYLFISHDLSIVRHMTTKVAVMYAGKIVEKGSTESLFDHAQHPYTQALLSAIPRPDPSRKHENRSKISAPDMFNSKHQTESGVGCAYASRCSLVDEICRNNSPPLEKIQMTQKAGLEKKALGIVHQVACYKPINSVILT